MSQKIMKPVAHEDVARLADMAAQLDDLKNRLPNELRLKLAATVVDLHDMAEALAVQHDFAIYALDDLKEAA